VAGAGDRLDLASITHAASREAGGVPEVLLGDYLAAVVDAAASGRRLTPLELAGYGAAGERAAESGVALGGLVDLFLSATWRLWREMAVDEGPAGLRAAGLAVLRAADDAVAAAAGGFERAYVSVARREEAERREFFDDLLSGRGGAGELIGRGERLGLRLAGPHQVVLAGAADNGTAPAAVGMEIDPAVAAAAAPAPSLVATRAGQLVAIVGAASGGEAERVASALERLAGGAPGGKAARERAPWQIAVGRPYPGPGGVVRSYEEAADALDVAQRLGLPDPVVAAADLLVYRVLLRDRVAMADLVRAVLAPLARARGGAAPLLATLAAYFSCGGIAAAAARELHLSVRAVTYRLARVRELTGRDPGHPADALTLQVAVIGAQLLGWPGAPIPPP
jgi:sugar diacid utilization regulator